MTDEPEILELNFREEPKVAPRRQNLSSRKIKHVCVVFSDDEKLEYDLDDQQGFYRETLTYEEAIDGSRTQNQLRLFNIFWTVKDPV